MSHKKGFRHLAGQKYRHDHLSARDNKDEGTGFSDDSKKLIEIQ